MFEPALIRLPAWLRLVIVLGVGGIGGLAFTRFGLPAAWLSGAMVATGLTALLGLHAPVPGRLRDLVYMVLGISMGSAVTPDIVGRMATWPATLAGLALTMAAVTAASYLFLRRAARWDPASAYFGSIPGALSMTLATAELSRADLRRVSLSQTIRLFMLVAVLPAAVASVEAPSALATTAPVLSDAAGIALLTLAGAAGSLLAARLGIPAGVLMGAFVASSLLHLFSVVEGVLPAAIQIPAFVALGAFLGLRFAGTELRMVAGTVVAGIGAFAVALAVAWLGAAAIALATGMPVGTLLVSYAPGGLEAMVILAFVLGVDPAFVAAHHLARFVAMSVVVPLAAGTVLGRDWSADARADRAAE